MTLDNNINGHFTYLVMKFVLLINKESFFHISEVVLIPVLHVQAALTKTITYLWNVGTLT